MNYMQSNAVEGVYRRSVEVRARFIARTYTHLFLAVVCFAAVEFALFASGTAEVIAHALLGTNWLFVLGGFVVAGWLASRAAHNVRSRAAQYAGLAAYIVAQAIIFVPMLYMAQRVAPGAIESAGLVTLLGFAGLTTVAFVSKKDFSFLGSVIKWGGVMALVFIVAGVLFGFQLGTFFSVAMVGLAGASVLWDTSNVLHHFSEDRYVGAALELFASLAMMFWYILRLFMAARD